MAKTGGLLYKIRAISVHIIFIIYSTLLWLKLIEIGEKTNHPKSETEIALVFWTLLFIVCQGVIAFSALSGSPHLLLQKTWINVPMLLFIIFNLPPYGFTLKHMYELVDKQSSLADNIRNNTCGSKNQTNIPMVDFILLQMVMPVLLVTFIIYPLPRRAYASSEYLAIAVEFMNAFDIMDMVGDFAFVQHYGITWEVLFYISLGMSVILISFPIKIEEDDFVWPIKDLMVSSHSDININIKGNHSMTSILDAPIVFETDRVIQRVHKVQPIDPNQRSSSLPTLYKNTDIDLLKTRDQKSNSATGGYDCLCNKTNAVNKNSRFSIERKTTDKEDIALLERQTYRQILKVLLTMVFTDVMFASLRFKIMVKESSAEYGFNMFIKNVIVACLHMSYLLQHSRRIFESKLSQ